MQCQQLSKQTFLISLQRILLITSITTFSPSFTLTNGLMFITKKLTFIKYTLDIFAKIQTKFILIRIWERKVITTLDISKYTYTASKLNTHTTLKCVCVKSPLVGDWMNIKKSYNS